MSYPSRQSEVPHYVAWFQQRGYRVIDLNFGDDYLKDTVTCCGTQTVLKFGPATASVRRSGE